MRVLNCRDARVNGVRVPTSVGFFSAIKSPTKVGSLTPSNETLNLNCISLGRYTLTWLSTFNHYVVNQPKSLALDRPTGGDSALASGHQPRQAFSVRRTGHATICNDRGDEVVGGDVERKVVDIHTFGRELLIAQV